MKYSTDFYSYCIDIFSVSDSLTLTVICSVNYFQLLNSIHVANEPFDILFYVCYFIYLYFADVLLTYI